MLINPFRYVSPKEMVCRILIGSVIVGLFITQVLLTRDFMTSMTMKMRKTLFDMRAVIKVSALGVLAVNSALSSNSVPGSMMLLTAFAISSAPPMSFSTSGAGSFGSFAGNAAPPVVAA